MAKLRAGVGVLEGGREVNMNGVGGMEIAEGRAFIAGVVDGLRCVQILLILFDSYRGKIHWLKRNWHANRKIGTSKELSRKEREAEEREDDIGGGGDDDEMDM